MNKYDIKNGFTKIKIHDSIVHIQSIVDDNGRLILLIHPDGEKRVEILEKVHEKIIRKLLNYEVMIKMYEKLNK